MEKCFESLAIYEVRNVHREYPTKRTTCISFLRLHLHMVARHRSAPHLCLKMFAIAKNDLMPAYLMDHRVIFYRLFVIWYMKPKSFFEQFFVLVMARFTPRFNSSSICSDFHSFLAKLLDVNV